MPGLLCTLQRLYPLSISVISSTREDPPQDIRCKSFGPSLRAGHSDGEELNSNTDMYPGDILSLRNQLALK
jgi:hypothetical protein